MLLALFLGRLRLDPGHPLKIQSVVVKLVDFGRVFEALHHHRPPRLQHPITHLQDPLEHVVDLDIVGLAGEVGAQVTENEIDGMAVEELVNVDPSAPLIDVPPQKLYLGSVGGKAQGVDRLEVDPQDLTALMALLLHHLGPGAGSSAQLQDPKVLFIKELELFVEFQQLESGSRSKVHFSSLFHLGVVNVLSVPVLGEEPFQAFL